MEIHQYALIFLYRIGHELMHFLQLFFQSCLFNHIGYPPPQEKKKEPKNMWKDRADVSAKYSYIFN